MTDTDRLRAEVERLRETLAAIKDISPEPIGFTGFVTGPQALLDAAQRMASDALSTSPGSAERLDRMLEYARAARAAALRREMEGK